ncbi:IS66 family insertion sequence element accessory protein TnpB, partial [Bacteroides sp. 224]|uniref:IS66 family insertion sequence element accessory protein TnpB n=1 Tax=Bacteroides sp. 224 TaxID=2302936 RepID=UPI0013D67344
RDIPGLCGEIIAKSGSYPEPESCHIFVDRSRRQLKILYQRENEYIIEHRALSSGLYQLERSELRCSCLSISWTRLNKLLAIHKRNKANKKMPKR